MTMETDETPPFSAAWSYYQGRFFDVTTMEAYLRAKSDSVNALAFMAVAFVAVPLWALNTSRPWELNVPVLFILNSWWFWCSFLPLYVYLALLLWKSGYRGKSSIVPTGDLTSYEADSVSNALSKKGNAAGTAVTGTFSGKYGSVKEISFKTQETSNEVSGCGCVPFSFADFEAYVRASVPVCAAITASTKLLAHCFSGRICHAGEKQSATSLQCNPTPSSLPIVVILTLIVLPFSLQQTFKLSFCYFSCLQAMSFCTLIVCEVYLGDAEGASFIFPMILVFVVLAMESESNLAATYYKTIREVNLVADLAISKQSQALFKQRAQLVRRVSHEMRSPLFVLSSSLECIDALCSQLLDAPGASTLPPGVAASYREVRELVAFCSTSRETAIASLDELLLLERVQAGVLEIHKTTVPISSFLKDIFRDAKRSPHDKKFIYHFDDQCAASPTSPMVMVDRLRMRQVVQSLVGNAQKFTSPGGKITLSLSRQSVRGRWGRDSDSAVLDISDPQGVGGNRDGGSPLLVDDDRSHSTVLIEVRDSGVGISAGDLAHLFQEGFQINPERTQGGGGTGYGLFISKHIVAMHDGGEIWCESLGEDMGTSFFISLPVEYEAEAQEVQECTRALNLRTSIAVTRTSLKSSFIASIANHATGASFSGASVSSSVAAALAAATAAVQEVEDVPAVESRPGETSGEEKVPGVSNVAAVAVADQEKKPDDLASLVAGQPLSCVLIVDDSQMVRKMLRRLLGMVWSDAEVLEAEDGLAALEIVDASMAPGYAGRALEAIIMDNQMPRLNGIETIKELKKRNYRGILLGATGNTSHSDFLAEGVTVVLRKPYTADQLREAMKAAESDISSR